MKYLKTYKLFESEIFGQKDDFSNQNILNDVKDILLELEDMGIECRIWTNNERDSNLFGLNKTENKDKLSNIDIEINYDNDDLTKEYEIKNTVKSVVDRLKYYFKDDGSVSTAYEDENFMELSINIF